MPRSVRLIVSASLLITLALSSASAAANSRLSLGTRLVQRYNSDVRRHDAADLRKFLSSAWQLQRADGSRLTKAEYLRELPTIAIGAETESGFRVTSVANVLVVTFVNRVNEVLGGKQYRTAPSPRLATFMHSAKGWQMTSYANFNLPQAPAGKKAHTAAREGGA